MRGALLILFLTAGLRLNGAEPVAPTDVGWLPANVSKAAGLPDDPSLKKVVGALPGWWSEAPAVTAPPLPPSPAPEETWVAVHVLAAGGECAFVHVAAPTFEESAPAAMRAARRATAILNAKAEYAQVFLGRRKIVLDEQSLPYSDWGEPIALGRTGYLCFDGTEIRDAITPFHALQRNEAVFRRVVGRKNELPDWHVYTGRQFLLALAEAPVRVTELLRGKPVIDESRITRAEVALMAGKAAGWLLRNVNPEGRLPYLIHPAGNTGEPLTGSENELRQWMATRAVIEAARRGKSAAALEVARLNVASNLRRFYRNEDDYGIIQMGGQVKLGAAALAALALREFPDAPADWREKEQRLEHLISFLWRNDGSFRTFLRPTFRANEKQNFYSGEALLYWATRLAADPEPTLVERFLRSLAYYRKWHLQQRNPAFVPWHTMAIVTAWPLTREAPGAAWVFEMNDWLLNIQQTEGAPKNPDTAGRFYSPTRGFGPPHASSTGVYLEGLCAALKLARLTGDGSRVGTYSRAIRLGLREARQLQFADPIDWLGFTDTQRSRTEGAFRTTQYDSVIRCDNVQHILQACWAALDLPDDSGIFAAAPQ